MGLPNPNFKSLKDWLQLCTDKISNWFLHTHVTLKRKKFCGYTFETVWILMLFCHKCCRQSLYRIEPRTFLKVCHSISTNSAELRKAASEMNPVHLPITSPAASGIVRILFLCGGFTRIEWNEKESSHIKAKMWLLLLRGIVFSISHPDVWLIFWPCKDIAVSPVFTEKERK